MILENETPGPDAAGGAGPASTPGESQEPKTVKVRLADWGGRDAGEVELDAEQAAIVKRAFDTLSGRYGGELERVRAEAMQSIGRPAPSRTEAAPPKERPKFAIPDPDLMFANKQAWEQGFVAALDERLNAIREETQALVQAGVELTQEEVTRREHARAVTDYQDQLARGLFDKHPKLKESPAFVWATMDEIYEDIKHLPGHVAYERLGEIAEARWSVIRGEQPNGNGAPARPAAPKAPNLLSSGGRRGAGGGTAPVSGDRKTLSDRILERQERILKGQAA